MSETAAALDRVAVRIAADLRRCLGPVDPKRDALITVAAEVAAWAMYARETILAHGASVADLDNLYEMTWRLRQSLNWLGGVACAHSMARIILQEAMDTLEAAAALGGGAND
ncbi:hypothetical protein [Acidisphaera rubrifaciens]|uniref:Uncharacterized protein n=1 Tax=Acidisphaera rubrifaciens HS-AP3 TaxID=1231350 RepID=A0A0D6P9N1_9PROT|nr:hypothetical protein [Acidisphaera rubrifaciens]GAN78470.1 hypothetical protein Asru_0902_03 [Acidisphaera rubrifaciens HS-AP3]